MKLIFELGTEGRGLSLMCRNTRSQRSAQRPCAYPM